MQWRLMFYHKPCYTILPEKLITPGHPSSKSMILLTQLPVSMMGMATPELDILGHLPTGDPQKSNPTGSISATAFDLIKPNLPLKQCFFFSPWISDPTFWHSPNENHEKLWEVKQKINVWMWSVYMDNNIADCTKINHFSMRRYLGFKRKSLLFK